MSLNDEERARTSAELWANARLAGVTAEELAADLGLDTGQVRAALDVREGSRPQDVWLVRDHLETLVREAGESPVPYTVLTRRARLAAAMWFPLRRPPRRGSRH
ncbi:DUF2316 family protein [Streptomyces sp. NPDC049954]|uniref:DUF2316 family protein n=1 Tax=Streptomyces sp. NPDC049954 TaxID=3155779 RepID=UPI00344AEB5B